MEKKDNAVKIEELMNEVYTAIVEEAGWEPKTSRDYMVIVWEKIQRLDGLPDRVTRLETNQTINARFQGAFTIVAAALAGYLGMRR